MRRENESRIAHQQRNMLKGQSLHTSQVPSRRRCIFLSFFPFHMSVRWEFTNISAYPEKPSHPAIILELLSTHEESKRSPEWRKMREEVEKWKICIVSEGRHSREKNSLRWGKTCVVAKFNSARISRCVQAAMWITPTSRESLVTICFLLCERFIYNFTLN